ncbi:MAG: GGDEF domain-containing protein [Acidobacteriota bacterium]
MELLLWRWSLAVQFASLAMITVFFAVLARSTQRVGLRSWVLAWSVNLLALGCSLLYWYWQPKGAGFALVAGSYMATKTAFLLLVIDGTQRFRRPDSRPLALGRGAAIVLIYSLTVLFIPSIAVLGVVQNIVTGGLFALGGYLALSPPRLVGTTWLGAALWIRSALSFFEAGVFAWDTVPNRPSSTLLDLVHSFLAAHSFIDTGAEWLLALACVLALSERVERELLRYNQDLLEAQEGLRRLADRDPLTGLANRRSLPELWSVVRPQGALLLFFDLNGFKTINDTHGHHVGDQCLRRFAIGLRECFRPEDALVRFAGDEFLVIASNLDPSAARERAGWLRSRLHASPEGAPAVDFSVGIVALEPGGDPEAALNEADQSMYRAKHGRRSS